MKVIVFTDCHIEENCLTELEAVFKEILKYARTVKTLVCVGDYYEKKNPTAKEIEFGTKWAYEFKKAFTNFTMVTGNHPAINTSLSGVTYLSYFGINVVDDIVIDNTYYGHFMVQESKCGFNETKQLSDITSKYKLSVLGHQHTYQEMKDDSGIAIHLGSCRYVDFGEAQDKNKYLLLVDDCTYLPIRLEKVRPMKDVTSVTALDQLSEDHQVRIIFNDFSQFLAEADALNKYKNKFFKFKVKFNFTNQAIITGATPTIAQSVVEIVQTWLDSIADQEIRNIIEEEFKKVL